MGRLIVLLDNIIREEPVSFGSFVPCTSVVVYRRSGDCDCRVLCQAPRCLLGRIGQELQVDVLYGLRLKPFRGQCQRICLTTQAANTFVIKLMLAFLLHRFHIGNFAPR